MDQQASEFALAEYLRVLRRRKWIVVLTVFAAVLTSAGISTASQKVYSATSKLLLTGAGTVFNEVLPLGDPSQVETQVQVLQSRPLATEVHERLGRRARDIGRVSVRGIQNTKVVQVTVESAVPEVARDAANLYADIYVTRQREEIVNSTVETVKVLGTKIDEARARVDQLDAEIAAARSAPRPDQLAIESLQEERRTVLAHANSLQTKLDQISVDLDVQQGTARVLERASVPTSPVRPRPLRNGVLAFALGLILGGGLAFLFEYLDDTVKTTDDVERHVPGLTQLGAIPVLADWRNRDNARLITIEHPSHPVSEAYRSLRTSIQFVALRQPLRTLIVTSPMSSEGKTTTLSNLAVAIARSGRRVVVVDCDLRRPRLHEFFGVTNGLGFTSVLLGEAPVADALQPVALPGGTLSVMASGPRPPNPSELLGTPRVAEVLAELGELADIVLLDTPPLLPVTDALVLSHRVDGVLLVATARVTGRRQLARAAELLRQADAPALGLVFNGASTEEGYGYAYRYAYRNDEPVAEEVVAPVPRAPRTAPAASPAPAAPAPSPPPSTPPSEMATTLASPPPAAVAVDEPAVEQNGHERHVVHPVDRVAAVDDVHRPDDEAAPGRARSDDGPGDAGARPGW